MNESESVREQVAARLLGQYYCSCCQTAVDVIFFDMICQDCIKNLSEETLNKIIDNYRKTKPYDGP